MAVVKSEIVMDPALMVVPADFAEPQLRQAGLAWLEMAVELFNQEVYSVLDLTWKRLTYGEPKLIITLDSSTNFRTKALKAYPGAPAQIRKRRERLDAAVEKLMSKTTPEVLWAAVANQGLARIDAFLIVRAWTSKFGSEARSAYPRFNSADELLFEVVKEWKLPSHPWL